MANNNNNSKSNSLPPPPRNPFGSGTRNSSSSGSRFGSSSRFGSRNRETLEWTIAPLYKQAVRVSLEGLGDPLHRLLGIAINAEYTQPDKLIKALADNDELREQLNTILDEQWVGYEFRGAALLYTNDENIRKAYIQPLLPTPPKPEKDEDSDDDEDEAIEWLEELAAKGLSVDVKLYRAIDVAFVLNVLGRARSQVLASNTPLALEAGFLDQTLILDDPRLVTLALATGCIEENWE